MGNPDVTKTEGIKSANYGKLVDGVVQKGMHINEDDVLIGKYMAVPKGTGRDAKSVYVDRSIIYKDSEEAIVQNVVIDRNEDAMRFAKVGLRKIRPLAVGDKLCLLPTAEVLTERGWIALKDLEISNTKVATMNPETFELSYVLPSGQYMYDYDSEVDGQLYYLKTQQIHTICTPNHKNFVKPRPYGRAQIARPFQLLEASECFGKRLNYKKDCINTYREAVRIKLADSNGNLHRYPLNTYLKLLGMFISDGWVQETRIMLSMKKERKINYINQIADELGITLNYNEASKKFDIGKRTLPGIFEEFKRLSLGALNKKLPKYVWKSGKNNCRALLDGLMNGDGSIDKKDVWCYWTSSKKLADDIQRLCLHAGYSSNIAIGHPAGTKSVIRNRTIISKNDCYRVSIVKSKNEPQSNHGHVHQQMIHDEKWIDYQGEVGCIEVSETHLFYYRENKLSPPIWTGNSSRSG